MGREIFPRADRQPSMVSVKFWKLSKCIFEVEESIGVSLLIALVDLIRVIANLCFQKAQG